MYLRDETDCWGLIQNGKYEPDETELVKKIVKKDMVCLDIGGNIGYYSILMAKLGALVYAYEPEQSNYQLLITNIGENKLQRKIYPIMSAVGMEETVSMLHLCSASHGMHRMFKSKHCDKTTPVKVIRIDDELYDGEPDFIKMDIEGFEFEALLGMQETIKNNSPIMLVEFHPPTIEEKGDNPKLIYNTLLSLGYDIRLVPNIDETISYEDLYAATNNESGGQNLLCMKKK